MRAEVVDCVLRGANPFSNVLCIRERNAESNYAHVALSLQGDILHARDHDLVDKSVLASEHVQVISYEKLYCLDISSALPLAREQVPLTRCCQYQITLFEDLEISCRFAGKFCNFFATSNT